MCDLGTSQGRPEDVVILFIVFPTQQQGYFPGKIHQKFPGRFSPPLRPPDFMDEVLCPENVPFQTGSAPCSNDVATVDLPICSCGRLDLRKKSRLRCALPVLGFGISNGQLPESQSLNHFLPTGSSFWGWVTQFPRDLQNSH